MSTNTIIIAQDQQGVQEGHSRSEGHPAGIGPSEFLRELFSVAPQGHYLELRLPERQYDPERGTGSRHWVQVRDLFDHPGMVDEILGRLDGKWNIYYSICLRRPRSRPFSPPEAPRSGEAKDVGVATACWVDEIWHWDEIPEPSIVVETSPGKFQGVWLLAESTRELDKVEAINRRIKDLVNGDPACDKARVLRLPGYLNVKEKYAPDFPRVKVVGGNMRRWSLEQLEEAVGGVETRERLGRVKETRVADDAPGLDMAAKAALMSRAQQGAAEGKRHPTLVTLVTRARYQDANTADLEWLAALFLQACPDYPEEEAAEVVDWAVRFEPERAEGGQEGGEVLKERVRQQGVAPRPTAPPKPGVPRKALNYRQDSIRGSLETPRLLSISSCLERYENPYLGGQFREINKLNSCGSPGVLGHDDHKFHVEHRPCRSHHCPDCLPNHLIQVMRVACLMPPPRQNAPALPQAELVEGAKEAAEAFDLLTGPTALIRLSHGLPYPWSIEDLQESREAISATAGYRRRQDWQAGTLEGDRIEWVDGAPYMAKYVLVVGDPPAPKRNNRRATISVVGRYRGLDGVREYIGRVRGGWCAGLPDDEHAPQVADDLVTWSHGLTRVQATGPLRELLGAVKYQVKCPIDGIPLYDMGLQDPEEDEVRVACIHGVEYQMVAPRGPDPPGGGR